MKLFNKKKIWKKGTLDSDIVIDFESAEDGMKEWADVILQYYMLEGRPEQKKLVEDTNSGKKKIKLIVCCEYFDRVVIVYDDIDFGFNTYLDARFYETKLFYDFYKKNGIKTTFAQERKGWPNVN